MILCSIESNIRSFKAKYRIVLIGRIITALGNQKPFPTFNILKAIYMFTRASDYQLIIIGLSIINGLSTSDYQSYNYQLL